MPLPPSPADTRRRLSLAPGHHLFRVTEGVWCCVGPRDLAVRVHGPERALAATQALLHAPDDPGLPAAGMGGPDRPDTERYDGPEGEAVERLLTTLASHGLLADIDGPASFQHDVSTVCLEGNNPIADAAATLLEPDVELRRVDDVLRDPHHTDVDVLVSCAGWLPDSHWRAVDRLCRDQDIAWHTCYAEGTSFYLGPFAVPGAASYTDTRARRLAASPFPDELTACWHYLDGEGATLPRVPWPDRAAAAAIAASIAADVQSWCRGVPPPSFGYQVEFDPTHFVAHHHPVLALPRVGLLQDER